ncbi:MAG: HAD family phosphatase [Actinomycetaceae bacterium]|nr:HAD family phosphatase [Actinomycetaceae bacterium]
MDSQIDVLLLDLGNVVIEWDPYKSQEGFLTPEEWQIFLEETDFWTFNERLDGGEPLDQARAWFSVNHEPKHAATFARYVDNYPATVIGEMPGMRKIMEDAKDAGLRLVALSNWPTETFPVAQEKIELLSVFEDLIVSGPLGLVKPYPPIFEHTCTHLGLRPDQILFVDDSPRNITGAKALGIDAVLFNGANDLLDELKARRPRLNLHPDSQWLMP